MVAGLMTVTDCVYALWMLETSAKHAINSGLLATVLIVSSGFVTRAFVDDRRMLVFAAIGAFLGSYLPVALA